MNLMEKFVKFGWYALVIAMAGDLLVSFGFLCSVCYVR